MRIMHSLLSWRSFDGKNIPSPLDSRAWAFLLTAAAILPLLLSTASSSFAGSATWLASPATGNWNTAANWTAGGPPNGSADTATFDVSTITGVSISANTEVNGIVCNAGASAFTITASPGFSLTISGVGITNNSGTIQNVVAPFAGGTTGLIFFLNSATAGSLTAFTTNGGALVEFTATSTAGSGTFTNNGGPVSGQNGGFTDFVQSSTAGNGTFTNKGGAVSGAIGSSTRFFETSTAGNAAVIANGGLGGGGGGSILFFSDSTGGTARVEVFGNGRLDISSHNAPGVTTGSIEGSGAVFLGAFNLTVGSNDLSTTFSGRIRDGGSGGGSGGSLTKLGSGKLTLSKASTYTGGTTVNKGTLRVTNRTGSATGTGEVQVNLAGLAGTGIIDGFVTIGPNRGLGRGIISPGNRATAPGILTINSPLTFNLPSAYRCVLNRSTGIAAEITALNVTIFGGPTGSVFDFIDVGTGTLTVGTVFTVINNTSAFNPISGTFGNLPDGSVFTSNGNNFQASYTGGTGNDLTLTVVP